MRNQLLRKWFCTIALLSFACLSLYFVAYILRSSWLTWAHEAELRPAIQSYLEVSDSIERWVNPSIMVQVATGKQLKYIIQFWCNYCTNVEVATKIEIRSLRVQDYASDESTTFVQYEGGWQKVDPKTHAVVGQCNVGVYDIELILTREDDRWKVADVGEYVPKVFSDDESVRLREKYCPK